MKVLVTGAGGQLGRALLARVPEGAQVLGLSSRDLDITDAGAVAAIIARERPGLVLNAAAYTAVDQAESDPQRAAAVNDRGVANLIAGAEAVGARVAHVSTDFVFAGDAAHAYAPDAQTGPLGIYGATKLAGERRLRANDLCLRTAWVYAARGRNFVRTMLRLMAERAEVGVVADQIGSPTCADDLADALWRLALSGSAGVFHFTNSGVASWYDFAVAIRDEGMRAGLLAETAARVEPIATADYPTPARRPAFSVLDTRKTAAALGEAPRHWRHALIDTLERIEPDD
ncbi:dTDP-4-dehydrorhamnose reductase [Qipengyuania sediminis]|uniref:dTDP-4-dehydrorhamnose reductase n=1 Tax=Qipengyuania sediminis TaxID=1532023 RepID=UPI0010598FB8|nr:dTDP-4-dehydrorhamnose reductase [Qipengyuania sediminis]